MTSNLSKNCSPTWYSRAWKSIFFMDCLKKAQDEEENGQEDSGLNLDDIEIGKTIWGKCIF